MSKTTPCTLSARPPRVQGTGRSQHSPCWHREKGDSSTGGWTRNQRDTISTLHQPDNFCARDTGDVHSSGNHHLWRAGHPRCPSCCTATADCLVLSEQPRMRKPPLLQQSPGHQGEQMTSGVDAAISNSLRDTPGGTLQKRSYPLSCVGIHTIGLPGLDTHLLLSQQAGKQSKQQH